MSKECLAGIEEKFFGLMREGYFLQVQNEFASSIIDFFAE